MVLVLDPGAPEERHQIGQELDEVTVAVDDRVIALRTDRLHLLTQDVNAGRCDHFPSLMLFPGLMLFAGLMLFPGLMLFAGTGPRRSLLCRELPVDAQVVEDAC